MNRRKALKQSIHWGSTVIFSSSILSLMQSCETDPALDWTPQFLNRDQAAMITALLDTLLPTTDTPGALDVQVHKVVDRVFAELFDAEAQATLVAQMAAFDDQCKAKFGQVFAALTSAQQQSILEDAEANDPKFARSVWGTAVGEQKPVGFYRSFKGLAINTYFSSKEVGMNVLNYDPVPGDFIGCVPFEEVGKVWSL